MSKARYLVVASDHELTLDGANGGAGTATLWLARTLAKRGHHVTFAAPIKESKYHKAVRDGVEFFDLGATYDTHAALNYVSSKGDYYLLSACRAIAILEAQHDPRCKAKVFMAHDPSNSAAGVNLAALSKIADRIVCVSEAQKKLLLQGDADPAKMDVVYNGADFSVFSPGDPATRNYSRFIFIGALVVDKGIHTLVKAFAAVKAKFPQVTLDVYGSAGMWHRADIIDTKAIEAAIPGIKFHGAVSQAVVAEAMRTSAATIISSIYFDSFPLTAVEAQVSGCPIIGFNSGGIAEAIDPGVTGILIPEVSETALAQTLADVAQKPHTLRKMAEVAAPWARQRFQWDIVAAKIESICARAADASPLMQNTSPKIGRIGFLSTWNQKCGLANFGRDTVKSFASEDVVVLAEKISVPTEAPDEPYVTRCWTRNSDDFSELERAIDTHGVGLLHLNCQYRFFPQPSFKNFLERQRAKGIKIVSQIHNLYTTDPGLRDLVVASDAVVVHTVENTLEVVANGGRLENTAVIPLGVERKPPLNNGEKRALRARLRLPVDGSILCAFGFVQPHKGIEGLIESVAALRAKGHDVAGVIAGAPMKEDPNSAEYDRSLREFARKLGVSDHVQFLNRYLPDSEVTEYLQASDIIMLQYRTQHYEASGAGAIALGAGNVVMTSIAPPFAAFSDAVWHITAGYPAPLSVELVLTNKELRDAILANAQRYCEKHSWKAVGERFMSLYRSLSFIPGKPAAKETHVSTTPPQHTTTSGKTLRVLFQNRSTTFTHRGGDTVVMERLRDGLTKRGIQVVIDTQGSEDPANFDVVHLFNFMLPDMVKSLGQRAEAAKVPFIVTTLSEDVSAFHTQSHDVARALCDYVRNGQSKEWYRLNGSVRSASNSVVAPDNSWAASHAARLLVNGEEEAKVVRRLYPGCKVITSVPLGYETGLPGDAARFEREFGVKDFVLCVGRIESRKNQLMLLKALEDSALPVVLVSGGFTYQPEYDQAVRSFTRKGKTVILGKLTQQQLADAYAAARVHVLPSWYELPGLVTLEAASYGKNVVVSDRGTARDYVGRYASYVQPDSEESIANGVNAGFYGPVPPELKEVVKTFSWERCVDETVAVYREVCGVMTSKLEVDLQKMGVTSTPPPFGEMGAPNPFMELLEKGEDAAKERNYDSALESFHRAESCVAPSPELQARLYRARGAVFLAQQRTSEAKMWLSRAVATHPTDAKALCGVGMCELLSGDAAAAYGPFMSSLERDPDNIVTLRSFVECAYKVSRFEDLSRVLHRYITAHPEDIEMKFCYAGAEYKRGNLDGAERMAQELLVARPGYGAANDLLNVIKEKRASVVPPTPAANAPRIEIPSIQLSSLQVSSQPKPSFTVSAPTMPSMMTTPQPAFNQNDLTITQFEEEKRSRNYKAVLDGTASFSVRSDLTEAQRERVLLVRAEAFMLTNALDDAEKIYRSAIEKNPRSARALAGRGALTAARGDWNGAKMDFNRALEAQPEYDVALSGLGLCAYIEKDNEKAWDFYCRALHSNPENARALLGMIELGYMNQRFTKVEESLKAYLELHPADLNFIYSLAGCLFAQRKLDEARSQVEKILLFDPENANAKELSKMIASQSSGHSTAVGGM